MMNKHFECVFLFPLFVFWVVLERWRLNDCPINVKVMIISWKPTDQNLLVTIGWLSVLVYIYNTHIWALLLIVLFIGAIFVVRS